MKVSELKHERCEKCGGKDHGFGFQRTVYYLTAEIKVRCNNCGDVLTIQKSARLK